MDVRIAGNFLKNVMIKISSHISILRNSNFLINQMKIFLEMTQKDDFCAKMTELAYNDSYE